MEQPRSDPEAVLEAMERLAGAVAHDLGNALTVVRSVTAALQRGVEAGEPVAADDVAQLAAAAARVEELARHLLAFSRRRQLRPQALDVNGLVERVRAELARLAGERVELILELAAGLPPALADPEQLAEALRCLVDNARQALPQGGRVRVTTAALDVHPGDAPPPALAPGAYVRLEVSDDGAGMSPAVRANALDPLFTTRRSGRGVGLGLAIADGAARASGGCLRLDAAPGGGTRAALILPRGEGPGERATTPAPAAGGTESILLVEGDARLRGLMLRALAGAGYEVHLAGDAGEAVANAATLARGPRLLLAELPPPGRPGGDLAAALRRRWPELRVLFTSSHSDDRQDAGDPILAKPFAPGELLRRVRAVLDAPGGEPPQGGRGDPM